MNRRHRSDAFFVEVPDARAHGGEHDVRDEDGARDEDGETWPGSWAERARSRYGRTGSAKTPKPGAESWGLGADATQVAAGGFTSASGNAARIHPRATPPDYAQASAPPRPSLPILLFPAVALWLSLRIAAAIVWQGYTGEGLSQQVLLALSFDGGDGWALAVLAGAAALCAAAVVWIVWKRAFGFVVAGAVCLGLAVGMLYWSAMLVEMGELASSGGQLHVKVTSDYTESTYSAYSEGVVTSQDGASATVRIYWDSAEEALPLGVEFDSTGSFSALDDDSGGWSFFQSGIAGSFSPSSTEDARWGSSLQGVFGSIRQNFVEILRGNDGSGEVLIEGIVLGNRSQLSGSSLYESFKIAGIAHLLAVSGSHLAIVMALVGWLFKAAGFSRRVSITSMCAILVSYLVLTGMQPSAFRACVMALLGSASWFAKRRSNSLSGLCLAILVMLALDPSNAFSVGFQLSVMGVLGLCLFMPIAERWMMALMPSRLGRLRELLGQPLAMTLTAQASTIAISVPLFGMLSLVGPLVNIFASPAISFFLGAGILSMFLCAIWEPMGSLVLGVLCSLGDVFCALVDLVAQIPHASIASYVPAWLAWTVFIACASAVWAFWPQPSRGNIKKAAYGLGVAMIAAVAFSWPSGNAKIVVLDVGQGDAILVKDGGSQVLIDTGQYDSLLRQALGRNGVYDLDAVVITHFDNDHCGSLSALQTMVTVGSVIVSEGSFALAEEDEGDAEVLQIAEDLAGDGNVVEISAGTTLKLSERLSLTMVWPEEEVEEGGNSSSICLLLEYDSDVDGTADFTMLLTGDAESEELEQMVDSGLGEVDAIKVGHHGSSVSLSDEALDALDPTIALISVGEGNSYGHPSQVTLQLLEDHGVEYWRTDQDGEITLVLSADGCTVSCANI